MVDLYVKYLGVGGGGSRESIKIENSVAKVNYEDRDCVSLLFKTEPTPAAVHPRIEECLRIKESTLENTEVESLSNLIEQSGFMNLDSLYGTDIAGRAYSFVIEIKLGEIEKKVTYLSSPDADSRPQAFVDVKERLSEISKRIISDPSINATHSRDIQ